MIGGQTRREGRAIPDGLQAFLAEVLEEHVVDVTAPTQSSESLPVIDLSFANVKDDAVKGVPLTLVVRHREC